MIPRTVRLLSVGIGDYTVTGFSSLPSSINDAKAFYDALTKVLSVELDLAHSFEATDIPAETFLTLLALVLEQASNGEKQRDVLLVLYFSGHATIEDQVLTLHFVDSRGGKYGIVTTQQIEEILRRFKQPEILLILDCCYSGLAGSLSKSNNPFFPAKSTVLSSSQPYEVSSYNPSLSVFTDALVAGIHFLDQNGDRISVSTIHEQTATRLEARSTQHPSVYLREGRADVTLKNPNPISSSDRKQFSASFVQALQLANAGDREALWYALDEYREVTILDVIEETFRFGLHEPLWLVRRAMGTTLAGVKRLGAKKQKLYLSLMESGQWMNACVGAIGARYDVTDKATEEALKNVLISEMTMDAKWLAFLYLADRLHESLFDRVELLEIGLGESEWGVCEIWERCIAASSSDEDKLALATNKLLEACRHDGFRSALVTDIALLDKSKFDLIAPEYRALLRHEVLENTAIMRYAHSPQRGILDAKGVSKWLYSKMHGVWRGQVQDSLEPLLEDLPATSAKSFLWGFATVPSVSLRMGIYQSMQNLPILSRAYAEFLEWGFHDDHPWVRRTALEWLLHNAVLGNNFYNNSLIEVAAKVPDRRILPGTLDLIHALIRVAKFWGKSNDDIGKLLSPIISTLAPSDLESVEWTMKNELLPVNLQPKFGANGSSNHNGHAN